MTNEGIEHSWNMDVGIGLEITDENYFRKAEGYINVTSNSLYIVDYGNLTMAAQFEDEKVPDDNCEKNQIKINNGKYNVIFYQYYNADEDKFMGRNDIDIKIFFIEVSEIKDQVNKVFWCTYY